MSSKIINISLPEELLHEVDQLARQEKRTRSELFREAVRRYLQAASFEWAAADRSAFSRLSTPALNRIWDNPVDARLWDNWERAHARKAKAR